MRILIIILLLPLLACSQKDTDFRKLARQTNQLLEHYGKLSPWDASFHALQDFGFSAGEIESLLQHEAAEYERSEKGDSVNTLFLINVLQEKIFDNIRQLIRHADFGKQPITELLTSEELSIVISDDKKLYNFSIDEKTGGTYRSRVSLMHYTDFRPQTAEQEAAFNEFFEPDGYTALYAISSQTGTKYVLEGAVRGCSYCFTSFVKLVSFENNMFKEEFSYAVENRDWNDGVSYHHPTRTIQVDYHVDDLTRFFLLLRCIG